MEGLQGEFERALRAHLRQGGEGSLKRAYELGRRALSEGRGILDMLALHQQSVEKILSDGQRSSLFHQADEFLIELMSAFEMTHPHSAKPMTPCAASMNH